MSEGTGTIEINYSAGAVVMLLGTDGATEPIAFTLNPPLARELSSRIFKAACMADQEAVADD